MSERRVRGPQPRQTMRTPRTVARHARDKTLLASGESVLMHPNSDYGAGGRRRERNEVLGSTQSIAHVNPRKSQSSVNGDIYLPPVLQEGWRGRDDVSQYRPYSPEFVGGQIRDWPQNNPNITKSSASHTLHIDDDVEHRFPASRALYDVVDRIDRTAVRNARATNSRKESVVEIAKRALNHTFTSDDERYSPEYRDMRDEDFSLETTDTSSYTNGTGDETDTMSSALPPQPTSSVNRSQQYLGSSSRSTNYHSRLAVLSKSASESTDITCVSADVQPTGPFACAGDENEKVKTKQGVAYCSIALTSIQLLILMLQLTMCDVASFDINPMIGPFPDAFSQWGGKNPYLMLHDNQWWRMVSPALLHVGVLHLAANVFCQLNSVAMFEREWGSFQWLFIYLMSELGCSAGSNYCDPDTIAVGSSGALMGVFGAKLAQVVTLSLFEAKAVDVDDVIRFDQLTSVLFGLTLVSMLGALTYIDWSGNMGGLITGFFAGVFVFSSSIRRCCGRFLWGTLGLAGLFGPMGYVMYLFVETSDPDEQLANVCEYFRSFFTENYECGCMLR